MIIVGPQTNPKEPVYFPHMNYKSKILINRVVVGAKETTASENSLYKVPL